jgi:hypothetical protein
LKLAVVEAYKVFSELDFFLQSLSFLQVIGEHNVSGPQVYPHTDFAWIASSPSTCEKKTFFGAGKIVFLQSLRLLQVIGENNVSGLQVNPHIDFAWIGSSPSMCEKNRSLKNCFSAKPDFIP